MFRSSFFGSRRDYPGSPVDSFVCFLRKLLVFALLLGLAYFCAVNSDAVLAVFRLCAQFLKDILLELAQL